MRPFQIALYAACALACRRSPDAHVDSGAPAAAPRPIANAPTSAPAANSTGGARSADFPIADGRRETFRGTLAGGLAVVMTLARRESTLEGSYFYEKNGGELALRGRFTAAGEFELEERADAKITGRFKGRADGRALVGEWSSEGAGAPRSFSLTPIVRGASAEAPLATFKMKLKKRRKAKRENPGPMLKDCSINAEYIAVYGARTPEIDDAINRALKPTAKDLGEDEPCDMAEERELAGSVTFNERGVLSVAYEWMYCCGAYPSHSRTFHNFATESGARFNLDAIVAGGDAKKLRPVIRPIVAKKFGELEGPPVAGASDEALDQVLSSKTDFTVGTKGLEISLFNTQPHVIQGAFSDPAIVPWSKIAPLLDARGPLRAFAKP